MVSTGLNIFFVGPTGAGKTTIGKLVAVDIHKHFYDVDDQIEKHTGVDIPWIFDVEGEKGFRQRESEMIDLYSQKTDILLATGAGAVLDPNNRRYLSSRGVVIYLSTSLEEQMDRTKDDRHRPLLQTEQKETALSDMREIRTPLYEEIADYIVSTDGKSAKSVSVEIIQILKTASLC